jgi:hypothetical protein
VLPSIFVLGPVLAERELDGASSWAVVVAAFGIGSIAGDLLVLRFKPSRPLLVAAVAFVVASCQAAIVGSGLSVAGIAALEAVTGVAVSVGFTLWETTLQEQIPERSISRVSSYDFLVSVGAMPVGLAIAGPLEQAIGLHELLVLQTVVGGADRAGHARDSGRPVDPARGTPPHVATGRLRPRPGRAEDLDPVVGGNRGDGLRRRLGERRDRRHEALEAGRARRHDAAHPVLTGAVGMRDAARGEREVAGLQPDLAVREGQRQVALEDVEPLVVVVMDMERRHVPGRHLDLDDAEAPRVRARVGQDPGVHAQEVELVGSGGAGHGVASCVMGRSERRSGQRRTVTEVRAAPTVMVRRPWVAQPRSGGPRR